MSKETNFHLAISKSWFLSEKKSSVIVKKHEKKDKDKTFEKQQKQKTPNLVFNLNLNSDGPVFQFSKDFPFPLLVCPQFAIVPHAGYAYSRKVIEQTLENLNFSHVDLIVLLGANHNSDQNTMKQTQKQSGPLILQCLSPNMQILSDPTHSLLCQDFSFFQPSADFFQKKQNQEHSRQFLFQWESQNTKMKKEHSWQVPLPLLSCVLQNQNKYQSSKFPKLWPLLIPSLEFFDDTKWVKIAEELVKTILKSYQPISQSTSTQESKFQTKRPTILSLLFLVSSDFTHIGQHYNHFPLLWNEKNEKIRYFETKNTNPNKKEDVNTQKTRQENVEIQQTLLKCNDAFSELALFSFLNPNLWKQKGKTDSICGWGAIQLLLALNQLLGNRKTISSSSTVSDWSGFEVPTLIAYSRTDLTKTPKIPKKDVDVREREESLASVVSYLGITWQRFENAPFHLIPRLTLLFLIHLKLKKFKNSNQLKEKQNQVTKLEILDSSSPALIQVITELYKENFFFINLKNYFLQSNKNQFFPPKCGKGVFVTIRQSAKIENQLKGCLGIFEQDVDEMLKKKKLHQWSLLELISYYTLVTLFKDDRFSNQENTLREAFQNAKSMATFLCKIVKEKWNFEVSLLYPTQRMKDFSAFKKIYNPCTMGVILEYKGVVGTFLPKVALEEKWITSCPATKNESFETFAQPLFDALLRKMDIHEAQKGQGGSKQFLESQKAVTFSIYESTQYQD